MAKSKLPWSGNLGNPFQLDPFGNPIFQPKFQIPKIGTPDPIVNILFGDGNPMDDVLRAKGFIKPMKYIETLGTYVIINEKIVIVSEDEIKNKAIKRGTELDFVIDSQQKIKAKVVRISEYPNPDNEFGNNITYSVLIRWERSIGYLSTERFRDKILKLFDNIAVVSPGEPNNGPGDPITGGCADFFDVSQSVGSDFRLATAPNIDYYRMRQQNSSYDVTVAIMDTGLKFSAHNYLTNSGDNASFKLAVYDQSKNRIGYCGITDYFEDRFWPTPSNGGRHVTGLDLTPFTNSDHYQLVCDNPFDDHKITNKKQEVINNRHGTHIAAIIGQQAPNARILPVKVFDNHGHGTLFDILCGFNYIWWQRQQDPTLRLVNCSWVMGGSENELLTRKFISLQNEGILVIAAAGNRCNKTRRQGERIIRGSQTQLYPACYSNHSTVQNVITVTSIRRDLRLRFVGRTTRANVVQPSETLFVPIPRDEQVRLMVQMAGERFLTLADKYRLERIDTAFENFGSESVDVGVVATMPPIPGDPNPRFPTPFSVRTGHNSLTGSSFATAYFTARVARDFASIPNLVVGKHHILGALLPSRSLSSTGEVNNGKILEL